MTSLAANLSQNAIAMQDQRLLRNRRQVRLWLYGVLVVMFALFLVGGATRLTDSGLSITEWKPVGTAGEYEIAHVKLVDHWNSMAGTCNNGIQEMTSSGPFGVWVWGWGSEDTSTGWVSYGYPAGEGILPINDVIIY